MIALTSSAYPIPITHRSVTLRAVFFIISSSRLEYVLFFCSWDFSVMLLLLLGLS